jgi:flagellar motility protein MotE (MotC chaperone)
MKKLLQSNWLAMFLGMVLYLGTTVLMWQKPKPVEQEEDPKHEETPISSASWNFHNPEVEMLVSELKKEKETLDLRQTQLNELAARLQSEQQEMLLVTQKVAQMQKEFDTSIVRVKEEETANIKRLAKMYATMSPDGAATIFKQMEETSMVKIMAVMKDTETAPILELMAKGSEDDAKRVANISERLRLLVSATPKKPNP